MILLDEAIERLNAASRPHGVNLRPWSRRSKHRRDILEIQEVIAPLRLPMELRAFWNSWNPSSAEWPFLDGFLPIDRVIETRERGLPLNPAILLPIANWFSGKVWIELGSATHPGGRIFRGGETETHVDLWAFGLSELFDLLAIAFERGMIDEKLGGLHRSHFEALATRQVREHVSSSSPRRIESIDRSRFPAHWLSADGLPTDHFAIKGATHTVASFKAERERTPEMHATLQGHYENSICGGPIRGCVGTFSDGTDQIQVFVPLLAGLAGSIGKDGDVELDVLSFAPHGTAVDRLSAKKDMQKAADMGVADLGNDLVLRLAEQMKDLDTSIVVMGLRPMR